MDCVRASCRNVKGSVKKLSYMIPLVKGKDVSVALKNLLLSKKTTSIYFKKILLSAMANAENKGYSINSLIVKNVIVDKSYCLKRIIPRSKGRYGRKRKEYSNVRFILMEH